MTGIALVVEPTLVGEVENWARELYGLTITQLYCHELDASIKIYPYQIDSSGKKVHQIAFSNKEDAALFRLTFEVL